MAWRSGCPSIGLRSRWPGLNWRSRSCRQVHFDVRLAHIGAFAPKLSEETCKVNRPSVHDPDMMTAQFNRE